MLQENLVYYRKQKGLSQEDLALSLHVVRQTISKWEKGLSVPDADMLVKLAAAFDVDVSTLLGEKIEKEDRNEIAERLEQLTMLLAEKLRRSKRFWKGVKLLLLCLLFFMMMNVIIGMVSSKNYQENVRVEEVRLEEVGDG